MNQPSIVNLFGDSLSKLQEVDEHYSPIDCANNKIANLRKNIDDTLYKLAKLVRARNYADILTCFGDAALKNKKVRKLVNLFSAQVDEIAEDVRTQCECCLEGLADDMADIVALNEDKMVDIAEKRNLDDDDLILG